MKQKIDRILGYFLALLMLVMTLDVLWGVLTRYAFGSQADWTEELARFLLIWIGILGGAYASGQGMHLSIDILKPKLSPEKQHRLAMGIHTVVILFALTVMVIGGMRLLYITQSLGQLSASLRLPMTVVYAVLPLSGALVIYYKMHEMWKLQQAELVG